MFVLLVVVLAACAADPSGRDTSNEPPSSEGEDTEATDGATDGDDAEEAAMTDGEAADDGATDDGASDDGATEDGADGDITPPEANLTDGCATEDLQDLDWFPDKVAFDVAKGIRATYDGNVKLVTIDRPNDSADAVPLTVALVQCGTTLPEDVRADIVVDVPVQRAVTYSTTFLQGFDLIGRTDVLVGHGGLQYASTQSVVEAAEAGDIVEVGNQTSPDLETLAAAEPDVIMVSAGFSGADPTEPFAALDVPVVPNASYLEVDPLGRAEWMKLEAMLLNEEAAVVDVFDGVAADWDELVALAADVAEDDRPTVLTNDPFAGTWFASGGESYTASLIAAAGGAYVFADEPGSTLPLDLETVLERGQDADVWLSAGSVAVTPEQFVADDERLGLFAAFPDNVWANDADLGPTGGNRFYEEGAVRPDLVLADVVAILHPDLLPDHEPRFYGLLGSQAGDGAEAGAAG
ncbi:ABC transporter substrate-binding protein [Euzebya rosea]|uniref:ABC transporter substrate-binding protein n=1 Tax=Euzebya rosea TaxID=2052804 RepID=UPI000D3E548F|nr:ABC transporter substrate-binding protein [Euzebya rosea]